jgi:putative ABC transport system permease protein
MMSSVGLGLRLLRRSWRAGEIYILAAAVAVAVAAVSSVGLFTDRVAQTLTRQGSDLLGGDLRVSSAQPIGAAARKLAHELGLQTAETAGFVSMVQAAQRMQLTDAKAVGPGYPLRGRLRVASRPDSRGVPTRAIPARGEAWVEPRLANSLGLEVGDAVGVGASRLVIGRLLTYEPDRGGDVFSIAPRLLMNLADLPGTELVQPGSRVRYRLLLAGDAAAVARYGAAAPALLGSGERLQGVKDARPELRAALDRGERFLGLAALSAVLLAGVAIAMGARRFSARQTDPCALMRCVGASQRSITAIYLTQVLALGAVAGAAGVLLGILAERGLLLLLGSLLSPDLPQPSWRPALAGFGSGLVTLLAFALPPVLRLRDTPTLRVLRRELAPPRASVWATYLWGIGVIGLLVLWQARDATLGAYVLAGVAATVAALGVLAWGLALALQRLRRRLGFTWSLGVANLRRRSGATVAQVVALGIGIMVMLLLSVVRGDLLSAWQASLPPDAPNRFLINVQPDQVTALQGFFERATLSAPEFYPMVRGRLVAINGRPVRASAYEDERAKRLVEREFNLSWSRQLAVGNRVVSGRWWRGAEQGTDLFSVESGIARTLGIRLGDRLSYLIAGSEITGRVTSLREVDWDSFRVNFFVLMPPGVLDAYPKTYITSFHLPSGREAALGDLVRAFPNVTVIDVDAILSEVRAVLHRVAQALEFVFLFTLVCGLLVMYAAVQSSQDERRLESAVMRSLGATRRRLVRAWLAEFSALGAVAGTVAACGASVVAYAVADHFLGLPYRFNALLWVLGPGLGGVGVGLAGLLGLRGLLRRPPLESLRRA